MNTLKELLKEQKIALKNYDYKKLSEINKQIFSITETERKAREKQKEIERDNRLAKRIENILMKGEDQKCQTL